MVNDVDLQTAVCKFDFHFTPYVWRGSPRSLVDNTLDSTLKVSEFDLQLHHHVHVCTNTLGKGIELPYRPSYGLNVMTAFLLMLGFK